MIGRRWVHTGAVVLTSCAATPGAVYVPGDPSDDIPGIETALTVSRTTFPAGEGTTIEITFANSTERDVQMRFPDTRQVILLVRDSTGDAAYADDHSVSVPVYLRLGPLEDWHYTIDWDGWVELGGRRLELPPGRYQLQAGLRRSGVLCVNRTAPVEIEVTRVADGSENR